jgi:hypothetical protein
MVTSARRSGSTKYGIARYLAMPYLVDRHRLAEQRDRVLLGPLPLRHRDHAELLVGGPVQRLVPLQRHRGRPGDVHQPGRARQGGGGRAEREPDAARVGPVAQRHRRRHPGQDRLHRQVQREVAGAVVERLRVARVEAEQRSDHHVGVGALDRLAGDQPVELVPGDAGVVEGFLDREDGVELGRLAGQLALRGVADADDRDLAPDVGVDGSAHVCLHPSVSR